MISRRITMRPAMLFITVELYGKTGSNGEFKEYESKALGVFLKHGGEIVVAYRPLKAVGQAEIPDEIQILKIGSKSAFEKFMSDPDRTKMAEERNSVIRKTEVYLSEEIINY